ncbi:NUDIX hydrolase [Nocardioides sp.]|uniref:NUDIX hydrolase n=1 Tax=Nocardioides sp. TaxID=35761 RepID=UPI0039E2917C
MPRTQRVGAYAVILRGEEILLSRLSERITTEELWTLPGGGLDHGEDPRTAVVREVYEEAGLEVEIGPETRVFSRHQARAWRRGRRVDAHSLMVVFDGWVAQDAPEPHTTEVDGSTAEAAWLPLADVLSGAIPTTGLVTDALAAHRPTRMQRVAAYGLIERTVGTAEGERREVLLTRISKRGFHSGSWTLPGGGVDFGESPREALTREVREECGLDCQVGAVLDVDDLAVTGTAPSGRYEEFHGIHLIFRASVASPAVPRVTEANGTTDAVEWVPVAEIDAGRRTVLEVVKVALGHPPGADL